MNKELRHLKSIPDIFRAKTPSLARMNRDCGEDFVITYLSLWILEMNEMMNIPTKMNKEQIRFTAERVFMENPLLTVADIKFVFDKSLTGGFGKDYHRLDSAVICTWFRKHWEERLDSAEGISINQSSKHKTPQFGSERSAQKVDELMKEAFKKYKNNEL